MSATEESRVTYTFQMRSPGAVNVSDRQLRQIAWQLSAVGLVATILLFNSSGDLRSAVLGCGFAAIFSVGAILTLRYSSASRFAELDDQQIRFHEGRHQLAVSYDSISEIELVDGENSQSYYIRALRPDKFTAGRALFIFNRGVPYSRELVEALGRLIKAKPEDRAEILTTLDPKLFCRTDKS